MEVDPRESQTRFDLPEEIWIHIFRCLDVKSVQNAQLVCKTWLDFILNDVILSGEYTFVSKDLSPSQINGVLAKRKNLKIVRFPFPYQCLKEGDIPYEYEKDCTAFDSKYVDFEVCKDLKKVVVQSTRSYNRKFVKTFPLPRWLTPSLFWFDPSNKTVSFGPENIVELILFIMPETGNSVDPSLDLIAKKMTNLEKLSVHFSPEALGYDINIEAKSITYPLCIEDVHFILPLLNGLQNCQSLHQLEISCNPHVRFDVDYLDILGELLEYISRWCPNISCLKLKANQHNTVYREINWCSKIVGFRNLEKLEIDLHLLPDAWDVWDIDDYILGQGLYENPMTKMKELKLNAIKVFFQSEFLANLHSYFPNLETFNLAKLESQGDFEVVVMDVSCWKFIELLEVLNSLGSIKNLYLPSLEIVLDPYDFDFCLTGRIFLQALDIIKKKFPLSIGDLKIIENKHGLVILKEKMKPPKMFNRQQVDGRSVLKVEHCEDKKNCV